MTREELEQAIENGESVWYIVNNELAEIDLSCNLHEIKDNELLTWYDKNSKDYYTHRIKLEDLYKSQAEAEHYLNHANVTRTETLPFLTWEEFNKNSLGIEFTDTIKNKYRFHIVRDYRDGKDFIVLYDKNGTISIDEEWEATEENFYKAYDECVRLFKGDE